MSQTNSILALAINDTNLLQQLPTGKNTSSQTQQVLTCINEAPFGSSPSIIAYQTGLKHSNVRQICRRLVQQELIRQSRRGWYYSLDCNYLPHGLNVLDRPPYIRYEAYADEKPRIQNLQVVSRDIGKVETHDDLRIHIHDALIVLSFGSSRNRVSYRLSCPQGVDVHTLIAVRYLVETRLREIGYDSVDFGWCWHGYEIFIDGCRWELGGIGSLTYQEAEGELAKLYNKAGGVSRAEFRSSKFLPDLDAIKVLTGASADLRLASRVSSLEEKVSGLHEAQKYQNKLLWNISQALIQLNDHLLKKNQHPQACQ